MAVIKGAGVPQRAPVCEATRERETFRYDDALFSSVKFNDSGAPIPSAELVTCPDAILTALARLAASQTGTARSLISLFDQSYQYIVAEATPTISLIPSLSESARNYESLWLCGTAIPRVHGVCEHTLCGDEFGYFVEGNTDGELPILVVEDLVSDPRFASKPYCQPGSQARFYAAVPIRTDRGVNIGVLCVMDTSPGAAWNDQHSRLLQELSRAVMGHLEATSLRKPQRRTERMSRGLRDFVENNSAFSGEQSTSTPDTIKSPGPLEEKQPMDLAGAVEAVTLQDTASSSADLPTTVTSPQQTTHQSDSGMSPMKQETTQDSKRSPNTTNEVFSKAADIVQNALEADGCLFLNADLLEFSTSPQGLADEYLATRRPSTFSYSGSESGHTVVSSEERPMSPCQILGTSDVNTPTPGDAIEATHVPLPQTLLARLIRRYPKGQVFNFGANGELQPDDLPEDSKADSPLSPYIGYESEAPGMPKWQPFAARQGEKPRLQPKEANLLLETFPNARSVAFVPIWDPRKERWSAGGFIHTLAPNRTFTLDLDLTYLRALGVLAASEAFRIETMASDKAKSDALGSLSHELRSPLHGAVLSVELLNDTCLSVPQQNILHTIETCCRTLSDTIDHLLEYSKVNSLASHEVPQEGQSLNRASSFRTAMKPFCKTVHLDILVEEVMESVYAGFNFQHLSIAQLSGQSPKRAGPLDITSIRRLDSMQAMEELGPSVTTGGVDTSFGDVAVFLTVDPSCSWAFYTHPGPMRRIVMNLFGNSLKYTHRGLIKVSLQQSNALCADSKERWVTLTVADTGVGIGQDFLQNSIFKPFAQENHLSSGTGVGLSFVKQMTTQLGGHISVSSRIGVGTTVTVTLPMTLEDPRPEPATPLAEGEDEFESQLRKLCGLRVRMLDFSKHQAPEGVSPSTTMETPDALVQNICRDWMHMEVNSELESKQLVPDLIIWSEDRLEQPVSPQEPLTDVPGVVLCANAQTAYQYATGTKATPRPGIFEFISQPLGPRKLARAFSLALHRWTVAQTSAMPPTSTTQTTTEPEGNWADSVPAPTVSPGTPFPLSSEETPSSSQDYFTSPEFLLVDDNFINLKILTSYMKKLKQPYHTATNGQEALSAYEMDSGRYVCILMDISMPIMDGFEATRRIRAFEQRHGLRPALILALTGLASEEAQREAMVSGVDLFLTKPVRLKDLGPILRSRGVIPEEK
ncbi:hypothetical protein LCI18_014972 [Fusarium solani-melongenae]|uniref:Uncharacterized protein n=1 Tax=Fusarium solani subsp. cucurbitae TaxID=2747967 RepID=A0ACD3ZSW1_FUSSC|nr:hypothetical protein LCI18_014972 [Fusarium solani-melongenae]